MTNLHYAGVGVRASFCRITFFVAIALFSSRAVLAVPVTYTGFIITDGQIASSSFHNARVILTFVSDTNNVQLTTIGGVNIAFNGTGTAKAVIIGDGLNISATFAANQIFVSFDRSNGGVGFGSYGPGGALLPAYPLGIAGPMVRCAVPTLTCQASSENKTLSTDLMHNVGFSGVAWTCTTFPASPCPTPTTPLVTDKGNLFLYQPYNYLIPYDVTSLNGGLFFVDLGTFTRTLPSGVYAPTKKSGSGPIRYNAFLVSDITIGSAVFQNAKILLMLDSYASSVHRYTSADPNSYINRVGVAKVQVVSGKQTLNAQLAANQIYVYLNPLNEVMGFGSPSGGSGYPLALDLDQDERGAEMTAFAVMDIINTPSDTSLYSPETATLKTTLRDATALVDWAVSCQPFDPTIIEGCSNLTSPPGLATDHGKLYLFEPYTTSGISLHPVSNNVGTFWSVYPLH